MKQQNNLIRSFGYAFKGIYLLIKEERNAKIHLLATVIVISAGIYFALSSVEWALILLAIGLVFAVEGINTAIEHIADYICPEKDQRIGKIKDIAAGSVLITAIIALGIAILIFFPKIF